MSVFYIMMEIIPSTDNNEDDCVGAYANCFVKASSIETAIKAAKSYIEDQKWIVESIEETASAKREDYIDDIESLEAYDEACEYGISAVFYTWSEEDDD